MRGSPCAEALAKHSRPIKTLVEVRRGIPLKNHDLALLKRAFSDRPASPTVLPILRRRHAGATHEGSGEHLRTAVTYLGSDGVEFIIGGGQ